MTALGGDDQLFGDMRCVVMLATTFCAAATAMTRRLVAPVGIISKVGRAMIARMAKMATIR